MSARHLLPLALAVIAMTTLAGCTPGADPTPGPTPSPSHTSTASPTPTPTASPTPKPTPTPTAAGFRLPVDCTSIASAATMSAVFGTVPARPAGGITRTSPPSAAKTLECSWLQGDATGGDVIFYSVSAADSAAYLSEVTAKGFACAAAYGGTRCDKTTPGTQYPVDYIESVFTRDDVWIYVGTSNLPVEPLLPDIVATGWAA